MILADPEVQTARAQITNYENFLLAIWLWNYAVDEKLEEKKQIVQYLRQDNKSIWDFVKDMNPKIPNPTDPVWEDCLEAVKPVAGNSLKKISQDLVNKYKL